MQVAEAFIKCVANGEGGKECRKEGPVQEPFPDFSKLALEELKNLIRETISKNQASLVPQGNLKLRGLGMFGESVLYAVPENEEYLQKVHEIFRDLFIQHDIWTEERSYTPHVTLFMAPGKNMNIQEADIGEK